MDTDTENRDDKLPWSACFGAVMGLILAVVVTMLFSAWIHTHMPDSRTAEMVWGIGSPLMGFLGVIAGFAWFKRYLSENVFFAGILCLISLILGYWLVFYWVGFPWKGVGVGV